MEKDILKTFKLSVKISTKTAIIAGFVLIILTLVYALKSHLIAVVVDGSPISRISIIRKLEKTSGKNLLDSMITEKLIQNEAKARNILVSNDEINEKIKQIENQVVSQGNTLEKVLALEGMSIDDLKRQITIQKDVEKLLADKINVTDEEVTKYIADNKITVPKEQEASLIEQIKDQLKGQKLNSEAKTLVDGLKAKAKIRYFVNY